MDTANQQLNLSELRKLIDDKDRELFHLMAKIQYDSDVVDIRQHQNLIKNVAHKHNLDPNFAFSIMQKLGVLPSEKTLTELFSLFQQRFEITRQVGEYKAQNRTPAVDNSREESQMKRIAGLAREFGMDPELAKQILRDVIDRAVENHKKIATEYALAEA